jgi:hypothetical protein
VRHSARRRIAWGVACLSLAWLSAAPRADQAQPPATEVYLATFAVKGAQASVGTPVNISQNAGYDNQPSFLRDSSAVLFASNRDGQQTDIYRYDVKTRQLAQITKTPENEYSPLLMPDRRGFSVVRGTSQHLWRFDLDGANPRILFEKIVPVGYHVWIDATTLALFVLGGQGQPNTMQIADLSTGAGVVVASGIGRSLLIRPGTGTVSFMSRDGGPLTVRTIDPRTKAIQTLVPALEGSQDAAWLADGRLVMARGRVLHAWTPGGSGWTELATLVPGADAFDQITRLAVSPDGRWLAFAAEPRQK